MNVRSMQFLLLMLYSPCYSDKFEDTKYLIEAVSRRRIENTMTKRKEKAKRQTLVNKPLHRN